MSGMQPDSGAHAALEPDFDFVADALVLCDAEGKILTCNRAAEAFLDADRASLRGAAMDAFSFAGRSGMRSEGGPPADPLGEPFGDLYAAAETGVARREWRYVLPGGRSGIAELSARWLREKVGAPRMLFAMRDVSEKRRAILLLQCQVRCLMQLARGGTLADIFGGLIGDIEREWRGLKAAVLQLSVDGRSLCRVAAPGLPDALARALDDVPLGQDGPPCAIAAGSAERVVVSDIAADPRWREQAGAALAAGLGASWSEPVRDSAGAVIGVLEFYHGQRHELSAAVRELIDSVGELTSAVLERAHTTARLEASEQRFRSLVMGMENMSVQGYDADRRVILWNSGSERLYGYTAEEALGRRLEDLIIPEAMREAVIEAIAKWIEDDIPIPASELELVGKDGLPVNVYSTHEMQRIPARGPEMYCVDIDLSERKEAEQVIRYQANYDLLTGLANRHLFMERLRHQQMHSIDSGRPFALFYMDLDGFKSVNDTFGHDAGDQLLKEAARRMHQCVRKSDILARVGGDEFTLIMPEFPDPGALARIANALNRSLSTPFELTEGTASIAVSIGIAIWPDQSHSMDELIRRADHAMYEAKRAGKNNFKFYA